MPRRVVYSDRTTGGSVEVLVRSPCDSSNSVRAGQHDMGFLVLDAHEIYLISRNMDQHSTMLLMKNVRSRRIDWVINVFAVKVLEKQQVMIGRDSFQEPVSNRSLGWDLSEVRSTFQTYGSF